jgi:arylsulfatase A-like enzyme
MTVVLKKGYGFSGNDWKGDHGGINEEDILVPCIFYPGENWPVKRKNLTVVDIAPTICRAFGLKGNYHFQGESLLD